MNPEITWRGDDIIIAGFTGSHSVSQGGTYTIAWYYSESEEELDEKSFVLLKDNDPVLWGEATREILDAKAADTGRFALHLSGEAGQCTLRFLESDGQELGSKQFNDFLEFFDLSSDGNFLFWSSRHEFNCMEFSSMEEAFSFQLEPLFMLSAARMETDGANVLLKHVSKGWYRFSRDGDFLDKQQWLSDYMEDCSGAILFHIISDLYKEQGAKEPGILETYAQWIEEALRRGIADSFHFSVSSVYEFLATLYGEMGDLDRSCLARENAHLHLDGFRLVDRAMMRLKEIGNPPNQELARQLIGDLEKAPQTKRLLEYPNYVGKLYRTKGEILELVGEREGAIEAYQKALEANPKAGCKKQLDRLIKTSR